MTAELIKANELHKMDPVLDKYHLIAMNKLFFVATKIQV